MTFWMVDSRFQRNKSVRPIYYIGSILLLSIVFPKLLPGWVGQITVGVIGLNQLSFSSVKQGSLAAILIVVGYLRDAQSAVETECERLRMERDAFHDFAEEVQQMAASPTSSGSNPALVMKLNVDGNQLESVKNCYRETVMAVPHYDEEFGESLRKNLAEEFDQDIATAVMDGQHFSPQLKYQLVKHARLAALQRDKLLDDVLEERNSLTDAYTKLRKTNDSLDRIAESRVALQSFSELITRDEELRSDIAHCEQLLIDRQQELHQQLKWAAWPNQLLQKHLYNQLETTFPLLDAALSQIRQLQNQRRVVLRELLRRD